MEEMHRELKPKNRRKGGTGGDTAYSMGGDGGEMTRDSGVAVGVAVGETVGATLGEEEAIVKRWTEEMHRELKPKNRRKGGTGGDAAYSMGGDDGEMTRDSGVAVGVAVGETVGATLGEEEAIVVSLLKT
ncbi:hypothetical protein QVD17_12521 [Tagetes erecta]|uniref:Uncharacterized protein n=1 Tax=Tagetes erecta TaxID=13708 RepID=A0AAD8KZI9_TARER|nr:hypothetical protein QVD17_12521 [Tagetes erecta]